MKIFDWFKSKQPKIDSSEDIKRQTNLFSCLYCNHRWTVKPGEQFPISVPSTDGNYMFQGIGVQCPECKKVCVYG